MQPGDSLHGFVVRAVTPLSDLHLEARELEHEGTGAQLLHLATDDAENLFSVSFPTPPLDDTGAAHVIEHSVLCGSQSVPVRNPYFEMRRTSMATFINAMTDRDFTSYPVASNVRADLFNLAHVCFDAVFHPLLKESTYRNQSHHLVPVDRSDPGGEWKYSGVVYNEMIGALSEPERRLFLLELRHLVPDTPLSLFSAGDPEAMPDLTYEAFLDFHRRYYHPTNARFLVYGDIDTQDYAAFLEPRLAAFDRGESVPPVPHQPRWDVPRRAVAAYPLAAGDSGRDRALVTMTWLTGDGTDPEDSVRLAVLSRILLGHEAAPLRKAIIESGLGADLIQPGWGVIGPDTLFRATLRGMDASKADAFESLVLETLKRVADEGVDAADVEAACNRLAYENREIDFMYPVHLSFRVVEGWVRGAGPLAHLRRGEMLERCRREWEESPDLFQRMIRERLLENPHRLTAILEAEPGGDEKAQAALRARMEEVEAALTPEDRSRLAAEAEQVEREAAEPNPREALANLPQLRLEDVPKSPAEIPTAVERIAEDAEMLVNDVFSNGINYLQLDFDLSDLPDDLWPYVPRYASALRKMGTRRTSYVEAARRAAATTGGIGCSSMPMQHATDPSKSVRGLSLRVKALDGQLPGALELLRELFFESDPSDEGRLADVTGQALSAMRAAIRGRGAYGAIGWHAARGWSDEGRLMNVIEGIPQLALLERYASGGAPIGELAERIAAVRDHLQTRRRVTASFTGSPEGGGVVRSALGEWIGAMPEGGTAEIRAGFHPWEQPAREGLAASIDTSHCVAAIPVPRSSDPDEALLRLGEHLIQYGHLLPEIRFKGNAYGANTMYQKVWGVWQLASFRDPHVTRTLGVFENTLDHVRQARWTNEDLVHAVLATAKNDERPLRPEWATQAALIRHLTGMSPEYRAARRTRMLEATPEEVYRATLAFLESELPRASFCALSSGEKLEKANRELGRRALRIEEITI